MNDIPFKLPDPVTITVDLPFPPSVNTIWRKRPGGMYLSPDYRAWMKQADLHLLVTRRGWKQYTIAGPCEARILLNVSGGIGDVDNRAKAVLDYAQRRKLVDNDKLVMKLTVEWSKPSEAPSGCRLILTERAG